MSNISCGIVGLPNVGKSTLFNALTNNDILAANYPFATIEPNTGIVPVPDKRLDILADLYNTKRVIPTTVTFIDIAGLVAGASNGEGLGNQFLGHIRGTNVIIQVVRAFEDPNVIHVSENHNPKSDIEILNTELILADLQTMQRKKSKLEKEVRANPKLKPEWELFNKAYSYLENGSLLTNQSDIINHDALTWFKNEVQPLTLKPIIYVFNVDESTLNNESKKNELIDLVHPSHPLFICAKLEFELNTLDTNDRIELLNSYGQADSGLEQLIHSAYSTLNLQSFLTAGEKEVRAWSIPKSATAPEAAGVIHSDFQKGFIAAEIVDYNDLIEAGSISKARAGGKVRTEGKNYQMQPNDVVEFRFNV